MGLLQVVLQQLGGPDRVMITQLAGSRVKAASIKGSMTPAITGGRPGRGASSSRALRSRPRREEAGGPPVVNGLPADLEGLRRPARPESPSASQSTAWARHRSLAEGCPEDKVFQFPAQPSIQDDGSHRATPLDPWCLEIQFYLSKNFPVRPPDP